jgi:hypothetical protein
LAEIWTAQELCREFGVKPSTIKSKISKGDFGKYKKVGDDMWRFEDGAIHAHKLHQLEEKQAKVASKPKPKKRDADEYVYFPSHTVEEAEALADELTAQYKENNLDRLNDLPADVAQERINNYWRLQRGKYMALKKRVKISDVSESERRLAFVAPVFIADRLDRMRDEDASYFISEWESYIAQGWDIENPVFRFFIAQLIEEQINIRRLQSVISVHEMGVPEAMDKSLSNSLKRYSDMVKQLNSAKYPQRPEGDNDDNETLPLGGSNQNQML